MNFDIGAVLTHAWQITWKHKVLWAINALPIALALFLFPIWLVIVFTQDFNPGKMMGLANHPAFVIIGGVLYILLIVGGIVLQIISRASVTLGVYKVEAEDQPIAFIGLLKDGFKYFWRIFGVFALISGGILIVFLALFACIGLVSAVTFGLGAICLQPLFLLLIPVSMVVMALMEQAESAVIADEMGVMEAVKKAYELVRANIWKYVAITIIVYFGMNILMSLIMFPLMIPLFFIMMRSMENGMDFNNMLRIQAVFGIVLLPVMALVQGVIMTYLKSAMMLTYLRLSRSSGEPQPVLQEAVA